MCDINCIWLFNIFVAVVLIILQQQQHVVASKQHRQQQQQQRQYQYASPYDGISSYATANAANYLHRFTYPSSSKPTHNVVKREIKNIKNTDFISYLNDFNIQDETSIPEDIIDQQHLQEIIDKQQQHQDIKNQQQQQLQQRYAGDNSATGSGVLNADDDIIDVNLPYDDSNDADADADADGDAADIILESQRSSERNPYNKNSKNNNFNDNNSKGSSDDSEELDSEENDEIDKNMKNKILQRTTNKKETFKARKSLKTSNSNSHNKKTDNKKQQVTGIVLKQTNVKDYSNQFSSGSSSSSSIDEMETQEISSEDNDEEDKFELDEDDDDDGSAEYERFKKQRELQQQQQQQQKQQQQQQQQHMTTLKTIINKKPFNSPDSHEEMINNDEEDDKDKIKHNGDNPTTALAIESDNNNKRNLRDYEIFRKHLEEQQKLLKLQQQQPQPQPEPKEDAIGDIEENENFNNFKTTNDNNNNNNKLNGKSNINSNSNSNKNNKENMNKNFANVFIPRKMKRHNGAARLDDATNRYSRLKQEQQQQQPLRSQINTDTDEITRIDLNHPDAVAKVSTQEENFKKKYYDILKENSTSSGMGHHLQHHRSTEDSNPKDFNFNDDNTEKDEKEEEESTHEMKKRQQQQLQQTAFEMEKTLRRNNKRYGHKTHKKKYKDYLRYSQIMMMATPSTSTIAPPLKETTIKSFKDNRDVVEDLNALRDKHLQKLKLEKIKSLIPAAPIFILKPREEKEKEEQLKVQEKVEESTGKPFYEGQINYFLETPDDDSERANEVRFITKGERMDTNDWYRKLSPVLRNGNKRLSPNGEERSGTNMGRARAGYAPYHHYRPRQHGHGQTRNHHYHQQHHHHQPHHHQIMKHSRHHAYQRKMIPKRLATTTTPLPPPSRKQMDIHNGIGEMGHQITDIKDLDRYYAKWPHLAKVQSQLHEEQMREQQQLENYPDYEYDNDDYFEENDNKDDNLPPYIRKFNRRNKQLLDLLEGTMAPPTKPPQQLRWAGSKLQTPAKDTSVGSMSVRIDDDYLKEKRKRYHQRQRQIQDLFAQQRTSTTTQLPTPYPYINAKGDNEDMTHSGNHLPDEDVSISLESTEHDNDYNSHQSDSSSAVKSVGGSDGDGRGGGGGGSVGGVDGGNNEDDDNDNDEQEIWQKEIETKTANMANGNLPSTNWQMEKLITSTPIATATGSGTTKKSAIHKLPSYPSIAGGYMNRPRSRSSQFAPSSGSEYRRAPLPYLNSNNDNTINNHNNFINAGGFVAYNNKAPVLNKPINGRFSANTPNDYNRQQSLITTTTAATTDLAKTQSSSSSSNNNHSSSTTFSSANTSTSPSSVTNSFIYHRVVDASPRLVGAGFIAGRKQRLPFVAITDRRLETSKKSLTDHQKDFEQNHYPLP